MYTCSVIITFYKEYTSEVMQCFFLKLMNNTFLFLETEPQHWITPTMTVILSKEVLNFYRLFLAMFSYSRSSTFLSLYTMSSWLCFRGWHRVGTLLRGG